MLAKTPVGDNRANSSLDKIDVSVLGTVLALAVGTVVVLVVVVPVVVVVVTFAVLVAVGAVVGEALERATWLVSKNFMASLILGQTSRNICYVVLIHRDFKQVF